MRYLLTILFSLCSMAGICQPKSDTVTVNGNQSLSVGVYNASGTLVRTLIAAKKLPANSYTFDWDGNDDFGNTISNTLGYTFKHITDSVQYSWEGVMCNTSDSLSGPNVWRGYGLANGLVTVGSKVYVAQGYGEGLPSYFYFDSTKPNIKQKLLSIQGVAQTALAACSDSNYVYFSEEANSPTTTNFSTGYVFAIKVSDGTEVTFSSGITSYAGNGGPTHASVLDTADLGKNQIGQIKAIAVQHSASYLFISRKSSNQIRVFNKTTGAFVRSVSIRKPTGLAVDRSDRLWISEGDSAVVRYTVNSDGTLTSTLTLSGVTLPQTLAVSYDGSYIIVDDAATSVQQLKAYNTSTGASLWTLGSSGGYSATSVVSNTRFFLNDINGVDFYWYHLPGITCMADGSFWYADQSNRRIMHFASDRSYVNMIMFLGPSYQCETVENAPTRLVVNGLEYSINYSLPTTTCWTLTNNYNYNIDGNVYTGANFKYPVLLSNGKTISTFEKTGDNFEIGELSSSGVRFTGVVYPHNGASTLMNDGSILWQDSYTQGAVVTYNKAVIAGFDGSGNPVYSSFFAYLTTPPVDTLNSINWQMHKAAITSTNKFITFYQDYRTSPSYHLGAIPLGTNSFQWQTMKSTGRTYNGDYPYMRFDDGNGVQYGGSRAVVSGRQIVAGYHGEFWKSGQTNIYLHYFDNGLAVGQFGVTSQDIGVVGREAAPGMAGNALTPCLVAAGGNYYLIHGDESHHGGVHRWLIKNAGSIKEYSTPVNRVGAYTPTIKLKGNKAIKI